jgi:hypothetical protein
MRMELILRPDIILQKHGEFGIQDPVPGTAVIDWCL